MNGFYHKMSVLSSVELVSFSVCDAFWIVRSFESTNWTRPPLSAHRHKNRLSIYFRFAVIALAWTKHNLRFWMRSNRANDKYANNRNKKLKSFYSHLTTDQVANEKKKCTNWSDAERNWIARMQIIDQTVHLFCSRCENQRTEIKNLLAPSRTRHIHSPSVALSNRKIAFLLLLLEPLKPITFRMEKIWCAKALGQFENRFWTVHCYCAHFIRSHSIVIFAFHRSHWDHEKNALTHRFNQLEQWRLESANVNQR